MSILTQYYVPTAKSGRGQVEGIGLKTRQGREGVKPISSCVIVACWSSSLRCCCMLVVVMSWLLLCFGHRCIFLFVVSRLSSCFSRSKMELLLSLVFCACDHQTDILHKHVKTVSIYCFLTTILQQPRRNPSKTFPVLSLIKPEMSLSYFL